MTSGERTADDAGVGAPMPSDADLLRAHAVGDPAAFAELVRRHRDRLWAVALRTIGDREEAADAIQDALLSAHRAAGRFRGDSAVTTWLHRIVVNACLDRMRRRQAHPTVPLPDGGHFDDGARHGPEPAAPVQDHDTALVVREALAGLPPEQRAAIVLVDVQGYAVAEAAEILGVAEGTIKSRCARGRARMALTLGHLRPDRPGPRAGNDPTSRAGSGVAPRSASEQAARGDAGPAARSRPAATAPSKPGAASGDTQPASPTSHGDVAARSSSDTGPAWRGESEQPAGAGTASPQAGGTDDAGLREKSDAATQQAGAGDEQGRGGARDAGHGNPGGSGRVPLGSAAPSEGRERP